MQHRGCAHKPHLWQCAVRHHKFPFHNCQQQRHGAELIAPFIAAVQPATWPQSQRQSLRKIIESKGAASELDFARHMAKHDYFLQALRKRCRQAEP